MSIVINGKKVQKLRKGKGYTQEQFAEKTNLSDKQIRNIESGAVASSAETLYNISSVLEVPMEDLLSQVKGKQ